MECPVCRKEFNEYTGRRPKKFCSDSCKVKFFNSIKIEKAKIKKGGKSHITVHVEAIKSALKEVSQIEAGKVEPITLDKWLIDQFKERLITLRQEIANPPKGLMIGAKAYISIREKEIKEIESKLNNH